MGVDLALAKPSAPADLVAPALLETDEYFRPVPPRDLRPPTTVAGPTTEIRAAGLGPPLSALPPTAASLDIATMSRPEQLRIARAFRHDSMALAGPVGSVRTPASPPAPTNTALPASPALPQLTLPGGTRLPLVALESAAPPPSGVVPAGLPVGIAGTAPLASTAPGWPKRDRDVGRSFVLSASALRSEGMAVRTAIGRRHGLDMSEVPVDRSVMGADRARHMQARGFTSHGGVVIPPEAGSLDVGRGQALLAHELTHVAQQARLGRALPPEHSQAGEALELEALSAERALVPASERSNHRLPASEGRLSLPLARPAGGFDQGRDQGAPSSQPGQVPASNTSGAGRTGDLSVGLGPSEMSPSSVAPPAATAAVQKAADQPPPAPTPDTPQTVTGPFANRPDDHDLSKLARWLYPLIRYQLKGELRENRERAGLLTDSYRRW